MKAKSKKGIFSSLCVGAMCLSALFSANLSATHTAFASTLSKESNAYLENVYTDGTNKYLKAYAGINQNMYDYIQTQDEAKATVYTYKYSDTSHTSIAWGEEAYFKFEPIVWQVLSVENGRALVVSNKILANMAFQPTYNSSNYTTANGGDGTTTKANDYTYSNIRYWLNGYAQTGQTGTFENIEGVGGTLNYGLSFYDTAFNSTEKSKILSTTLTANGSGSDITTYSANASGDKVFLLSQGDATAYFGKEQEGGVDGTWNPSIIKKSTDLALSQVTADYSWIDIEKVMQEGTFESLESQNTYGGNWWLRSPYSSYSNYAYYVRSDGIVHRSDVEYVDFGVVPALYLDTTGLQVYDNAECTSEASTTVAVGKYIKFGSYPQSYVSEQNIGGDDVPDTGVDISMAGVAGMGVVCVALFAGLTFVLANDKKRQGHGRA